MKKKIHSLLALFVAFCMTATVVLPAFAASGTGKDSSPFIIDSSSVEAVYRYPQGGEYVYSLSYTGGNFSNSYVTSNTAGYFGSFDNIYAKKLVVGDKEYVRLTADIPTEVVGDGTLYYAVANASKTVTGVGGSSKLSVDTPYVARISGVFGRVSGTVTPSDTVTLGGDSYTIVGNAETPKKVTVTSGTAYISGYFSELTINGANVIISGDTYITDKITRNSGSLTINQETTFCVGGNSVKPSSDLKITTWGKLPAATYESVSGSWVLDGNVTVENTVCGIGTGTESAGHLSSEDLSVTLNEKTLTIKNGTVKASGGTIIGDGGKAELIVSGDNLKVSGNFKSITMGTYAMTVPAGKTVSAYYNDKFYSVKVLQDTVFTAFKGVLPTNGNDTAYRYANVIGDWIQGTNDNNPGEDVDNTDETVVIGKNTSLTVTQDNTTISGIFSNLDTGTHTVKIVGDTVINGGTFKVRGLNDTDALAAGKDIEDMPCYSLTINGGDGVVTGKIKKLTVTGGAVVDESAHTLSIDNTGITWKDSAISVEGGTLTLSNSPEIKVNGDLSTPAVKVVGGTMTIKNGSVEAWGNEVHGIDVSNGGKVFIGDINSYDQTPTIISHDKESSCVYVNNKGNAIIYRGEFKFNGESSFGVRVNNGGIVKIYPNDEYGIENTVITNPMVYIHGDVNTRAAMWINEGGAFEIRGRGALLEQPYRDDNGGYALYISNNAKLGDTPLAGGTFNGEIFYQFDGNTHKSIAALIPANYYLRFDESAPNYGKSDGTYGILPYGTYTDADKLGDYVTFHNAENAFNEAYIDKVGKRGEYYSIIDAEWELRTQMGSDGSYQLPAGMMDGSGAVTNTLILDKNDPAIWAISQNRGDVNVTGNSKLYLAGRILTYDGKGSNSSTKVFATDSSNTDKLHTIALSDANADLLIADAIYNGAGTDVQADDYAGGYIGTGKVEYTGASNDETAAVHVCYGKLHITSAKLSGGISGVYVHNTGIANFGAEDYNTANENNDNKIISIIGSNQALKIDSGAANIYGGTLKAYGAGETYGIAVAGGTLNVKGGVISGNNNTTGYGIYTTGGTTNVTGGCLYGTYADDDNNGISLLVNGGTSNLKIDEAHKQYTEKATDGTSNYQHINNICVESGILNVGAFGEENCYNHNNGTLALEGGTTYYFDGVTVGDTNVYGAAAGSAGANFGTQVYVEDGDFGVFKVLNYDNALPSGTNSYLLSGSGSLRDFVQLHGGYFDSIVVDVKVNDGTSDVQDIIGVWANKKYDGNIAEWGRFNHYAEQISGMRNDYGTWTRNSEIQSGTAITDDITAITSASGKAISIRSAVDELKTWAANIPTSEFALYANLWIDDSPMCNTSYCDAGYTPVKFENNAYTIDFNGFGIFGEQTDALLTVDNGGKLTVVTKNTSANKSYANRIRNFNGVVFDVASSGVLNLNDIEINSTSGNAITTSGTTNVNSGIIGAGANGIEQLDGSLNISGGKIAGTAIGLNRIGAKVDNKNFIKGGTFSGITTVITGETLSDLLAKGKTFIDIANIDIGKSCKCSCR